MASELSCHTVRQRDINDASVKAFLQAKRDLLRLTRVGICFAACLSLTFSGCEKNEPIDEAKAAGKSTADFPQITADIFKPMDGGIELSPEEIMGRNTWNLWSAGNQNFWNHAAQDSYGLMDLLKMLDSRKFPRGERFKTLGLVNEPGFRAATKADEFGLWLDEQVEQEPAGIDETVYGKSSGVLGFRLFPNPDFNEEARKKWDGDRFINDPTYYNDNETGTPVSRRRRLRLVSHRAESSIRQPIRRIRAGKISHRPLVISTSTKEKSLPVTSRKADFSMRCWLPSRAARPTLRGSPPITSTIQTRSMQSFCWLNGNALQNSQLQKRWRVERSRCPVNKRRCRCRIF